MMEMEPMVETLEPMDAIANKPPTIYTESDIQIIDGAIPSIILGNIRKEIREKGFNYGWPSNRNKEYFHWNTWFGGKNRESRKDVTNQLTGDVLTLWSLLQSDYLQNTPVPIRVYANGYTYGTEGYIHTDSDKKNDKTILIYMNKIWDRDWAGETMFFQGDTILKAVLPKCGRIVIFPSALEHCARSVSRICPELRTILVYKARREKHDTELS